MKYITSPIFNFLVISLSIAVLFVQPVLAEDDPITVEADHMSSTEKTNSVLFTGDVDARQGDVRIRSDEMTVYYSQKGKDDQDQSVKQKVEKMINIGNVEITRGKWLGTSKKSVYLAKERQFILTGDAKAWENQNMISGEKIIYYIDEERSEVIGQVGVTVPGKSEEKKEPGRVNMTILQN
jgi:lipopolysaccharide export system protein LptA